MMKRTHNQPLNWNFTGPKFKTQVTLTIWILTSIIIGSINMIRWIIDSVVWLINIIT